MDAIAGTQRIGVVGAGFIGSGIAEAAARAGVTIVLHEPEAAPLESSGSPRARPTTPPRTPERTMRNAKLTQIYGTNEIQRMVIARTMR